MSQNHDPFDPDRRIRQPGPALEPRAVVVPARGAWFEATLATGLGLVPAIGAALRAKGFESGVVELEGGGFGPFAYVIPALSETGANAAFYSDVRTPSGVTTLATARVTFGQRDGADWLHAHGLWMVDGRLTGGHIMPHETVIAAPIRARIWGMAGVVFATAHDPETNFTLLAPVSPAHSAPNCLAVRLRPNQDIHDALETICRTHGIAAAEIAGGVASSIGAHDEGGTVNVPFATEIFITRGLIGAEAVLDVAMIDWTGTISAGRLRRGANPVLMTAELVLIPTLPAEVP